MDRQSNSSLDLNYWGGSISPWQSWTLYLWFCLLSSLLLFSFSLFLRSLALLQFNVDLSPSPAIFAPSKFRVEIESPLFCTGKTKEDLKKGSTCLATYYRERGSLTRLRQLGEERGNNKINSSERTSFLLM